MISLMAERAGEARASLRTAELQATAYESWQRDLAFGLRNNPDETALLALLGIPSHAAT
nr:hypothetical protein [uncultured Lichenicoccus sp.]